MIQLSRHWNGLEMSCNNLYCIYKEPRDASWVDWKLSDIRKVEWECNQEAFDKI